MLPAYSLEAEFTRPAWVFGINSYEIINEQSNIIACSYRYLCLYFILHPSFGLYKLYLFLLYVNIHRQKGRSYLGILDTNKSTLSILETPFTDLRNIVMLRPFWLALCGFFSSIHCRKISLYSVNFHYLSCRLQVYTASTLRGHLPFIRRQ